MDAAPLLEKITLLIELAQRGEIDPWDVQVIDVIDRYLNEMLATTDTQIASEADLSQSGQAFLSASMLVLFKANTLVESELYQAEQPPEDAPVDVDATHIRVRLPLEQQLRRRPAALPPQKRRVSVQELIQQLQLMATQLKAQQAVAATHNPRLSRKLASGSRTQIRHALELAHQENLTEVAGELELFLNSSWHNTLMPDRTWLNLDQLVELWTQKKSLNAIEASSHLPVQERVSVFWALLLLSAQSKVELSQEEFYQEIKIRTVTAE